MFGGSERGCAYMTSRSHRISQEPRGPDFHSVRDELLAVACKQFAHLGYAKTTVNDLAEAIGFSKAYVYKFFASKQAIGDAIAARCLTSITRAVAEAVDGNPSATTKLRSFVGAFDAQCHELRNVSPNLNEIVGLAEMGNWPSWLSFTATKEELLRPIITAGRKSAEFERKTPLDEVCAAILTALRPVLYPTMLRHAAAEKATAVNHLTGLILRSLAP